MTMTRTVLLLTILGALACAASTAEPNAETSSTSDETTADSQSDPVSSSASGSAVTTADPSVTSSDDGSDSGATSSDTSTTEPPAPACDPIVQGEYNACLGGNPPTTVPCTWTPNPEGDGWITCITAALVHEGSVCSIAGCVDRCDCFPAPATGTATVECMDGIIEDATACVLFCGGGEICPDGMECSYNICVAPPA